MENQNWFIFQEGHHRGPFSLDQMKKFLKKGTVKERTKVWHKGHSHWRNLSQFEEFQEVIPTLPLSEIENPPPITDSMFVDMDKYPSLEEIVATQLHPEQKIELKKELKNELKREIKGEIKPEMEPQIRAEIHERRRELQDEIQKEMGPRIKAEVIDHRIELKKELKKEISGEIGPELMRPHIKSELVEQRDDIKHELKQELSPRIKAEVLDQKIKLAEEFDWKLLNKSHEIDHKLKNKMGPEHLRVMSGKLAHDLKNTIKDELELNVSFEKPKLEDFDFSGAAGKQKASPLKKAITTIMVGVPLAFLMIYFLIYIPSLEFERPLDMPDSSFKKFSEVTKTDLFLGVKSTAAFSFTGEKLFFASNMAGQGHYQLKIESVPGKILSTTPVRAVAKGFYQNKMAAFKRFTMQEGRKFVPGDYRVTITAEKFEWAKTFWDIFIDGPMKAPIYKGVITWKGKNPKEFDKVLAKFLQKVASKRELVLEEIKQKYLTKIGLLDKMQEFLKSASRNKRAKVVFRRSYMREIGPILSSLSLKSKEAMTKVNITDPYLYKQYENQLKLGKKIGLLATDIIDNLKSRNNKQKSIFLGKILKLKEKIFLQTYKKVDHTQEM